MSMQSLERAIREEAQTVLNNPKLKNKDILQWSTGSIVPMDDTEVVVSLPVLNVRVCVLKIKDKR